MLENKIKIGIIDYECGNILSVKRSIERLNYDCFLVKNKKQLANCTKVILPGVGNYKIAISKLKKKKLYTPIVDYIKRGKPILGICLGMQILMRSSQEEGSKKNGFNVIEGKVEKIPLEKKRKIPNIGWCKVFFGDKNLKFKTNEFYFVHSYHAIPKYKKNFYAFIKYGKQKLCAVVKKGNILGCQFHPEKSSTQGLLFMKYFIENFK